MWRVVPLCRAQLMDVNPRDVLNGGLYRRCNTYKGGGGYDKFPEIYRRRFGDTETKLNDQFVVQLQGCPLECPYCYVTAEGVLGECQRVSTEELVRDFEESKCGVFHLMGGAPALWLEEWPELLGKLDGVFHSDFLGVEGEYSEKTLEKISKYKQALYAISVKGATPEEFKRNTGTEWKRELFERNLERLRKAGLECYFTFTGMPEESIERFKKEHPQWDYTDSFGIELVHYKALDYKESV